MVTITGWYIGVPWLCFWGRHSLTFHHHHFGGEFRTGKTWPKRRPEAPLNITQKCSRLLLVVGSFNPFKKYQSNWIISPSRVILLFFFWGGEGGKCVNKNIPKRYMYRTRQLQALKKKQNSFTVSSMTFREKTNIYIYIHTYVYIYTHTYTYKQLEPKFPASLHSLRDSLGIRFPNSVFLGSKSPSSLSLRRDCTVLLVKGGVFLPGIFGPSFCEAWKSENPS